MQQNPMDHSSMIHHPTITTPLSSMGMQDSKARTKDSLQPMAAHLLTLPITVKMHRSTAMVHNRAATMDKRIHLTMQADLTATMHLISLMICH